MAASVAVIGAGIVGVSCALHLQRRGLDVTLIDRGAPGQGTSFGNAGVLAAGSIIPVTVPGLAGKTPRLLLSRDGPLFLRWSYLPRLAPWLAQYLRHCDAGKVRHIARHLTPLVEDSFDEHMALAKGTEAARHLRRDSYVFAYKSRAACARDAFGLGLRQENGIDFEIIEGDDAGAFLPEINPAYRCLVVFSRQHGAVSAPGEYVAALARAFEAAGGRVIRDEIEEFTRSDGRVSGVRGRAGAYPAGHVVLATGPWSRRLMQRAGLDIPLESERGYHVEFSQPSVTLVGKTVMFADGKFVANSMGSNMRLAGLVEFGGLDAPASRGPIALLMRAAKRVFRDFHHGAVTTWMGHRPAPADSLPLIGPVPAAPGLVAAFGHHHIGLTSGPKTGRIVAELISGRRSSIDLSAYRPERFA